MHVYLNCERAELNRSTGQLTVHYRGILSDVHDPPYSVLVEAVACSVCGGILALGDALTQVGDSIQHVACSTCTCPICVMPNAPSVKQESSRTPELVQLSLF